MNDVSTEYLQRLAADPTELVRVPEAARLLGAGRTTLREHIDRGALTSGLETAWGAGSMHYVRLDELERWRIEAIRDIRAGEKSWTHNKSARGLLPKLIAAGGDPGES